jgi:hypothetical protein
MARCVFCNTTSGLFSTREHVLPEALGGGDWAILPDGLFCDSCQNKFGSEIEQQALGDYPFSFFRVFLAIPTKKRKSPWFDSSEGIIRASLRRGTVGYDPAPFFQQATSKGKKTQMRLFAHPHKPEMICRFLIKMGIEVVASDDEQAVFSPIFDEARLFALTGEKTRKWWYFQRERMDIALNYFTEGITKREWGDGVKLEVVNLDYGQEIFRCSLLYLDLIVPLTSMIRPALEGLEEPEYRLFCTVLGDVLQYIKTI